MIINLKVMGVTRGRDGCVEQYIISGQTSSTDRPTVGGRIDVRYLRASWSTLR